MNYEDDCVVKIKEKKQVKLNNAVAIAGFAGTGLVGTIAVNHIIENLNMKEFAYFSSKLIPAFTIFMDGLLKYPFRIYVNDEGTLVAILSEVPLNEKSHFDIAYTLLDWLESKNISEITVLSGVTMVDSREKNVFAAAEPEVLDKLTKKGITLLGKGLIAGIAASILNQSLHRDITGICLLAPTTEGIPNPEAAARLIDALNKIYDFNINTDPLLQQAEIIRKKRREVTEAMKTAKDRDVSMRLYL
ncbi:MAG: proteasome assembly chaperone family protein [Candidatus Odinarchaeia archaeon]